VRHIRTAQNLRLGRSSRFLRRFSPRRRSTRLQYWCLAPAADALDHDHLGSAGRAANKAQKS
jgi:hypothetical protein